MYAVQYNAPTSVYTCKDIAKKEWDSFFQNHPQLIGMSIFWNQILFYNR